MDTAGQERFRTITSLHYRNAMGILLVYDVTNEQSFRNIEEWMTNIEKHTMHPVDKILIGQRLTPQHPSQRKPVPHTLRHLRLTRTARVQAARRTWPPSAKSPLRTGSD